MRGTIAFLLIVSFIAACASPPQQRIVESPESITGGAVTDPVTSDGPDDVIDDGAEEPEDDSAGTVEEEDDGKAPDGGDPLWAGGPLGQERHTAYWAYREALDAASDWSPDARLYAIRGTNLIEGKLTDDHYVVEGFKVYSSVFVVSFTSGRKGDREILDIKVDHSGGAAKTVPWFIPASSVTGAKITGWAVDSDDISDLLEGIAPGLGYAIKSLEIVSSGAVKIQPGNSLITLATGSGDLSRADAYAEFEDGVPIGVVQAHTGVTYEFDLRDGSLIGYRRTGR